MKQHLIFAIAFAGVLALGAVQGNRVTHIREAETFYRWLVSTSTQYRMGQSLEFRDGATTVEPLDDEIFAQALEQAEAALPAISPPEGEDAASDAAAAPKLVRAVQVEADDAVWDFARGAAAAPVRTAFFDAYRAGRLHSVGTQLNTADLYEEDAMTYGAGLSSLFFGFRKVAANFIWMQVDQFWHAGQYHRMVPLMRTVVTLDPNFVDAYLLGAWHLAYNLTAKLPVTPEPLKEWNEKYQVRVGPREIWYYVAADFLKDGIRKNPRDYRLYFDLGYAIYDEKLADYPNAIRFLSEARRYEHNRWVPRRLALAYMYNGNYPEAIEVWNEYHQIFPDNEVAPRFLAINHGLLSEATADQAFECAQQARAVYQEAIRNAQETRTTEGAESAKPFEEKAAEVYAYVEEMEAIADIEQERAMRIWVDLIEHNPQENIAQSHVHQMTAEVFRRDGRYLEAVAELQLARWADSKAFDEISNRIIAIKQEGGIPLDISEKLALERQAEAAQYQTEPKPEKPRFVECPYVAPVEEAA